MEDRLAIVGACFPCSAVLGQKAEHAPWVPVWLTQCCDPVHAQALCWHQSDGDVEMRLLKPAGVAEAWVAGVPTGTWTCHTGGGETEDTACVQGSSHPFLPQTGSMCRGPLSRKTSPETVAGAALRCTRDGSHQATRREHSGACQGGHRTISSGPRGFLVFFTGDWKGLSCAEPLEWGLGGGEQRSGPCTVCPVRKSA